MPDVKIRLVVENGQLKVKLAESTRAVDQATDRMERDTRSATTQAQGLAAAYGGIKRAVAGAFAGASAFALVRGVSTAADEVRSLDAQLRNVTGSEEQFNQAQRDTFAIAQDTRQSLGATVNLYARLSRSTEDLGTSQADIADLTRLVNQAFVVSGATAQEASAAITQLSQGLQAGALRGEEFNSVAEQAPLLLQALADGLDVPRSKLRELAFDGELTTERLVSALLGQKDALEAQFAEFPDTVSGSLQRVRNAVTTYIAEQDRALGGTGALSQALNALAENIDTVGRVAATTGGILAAALAGRAANALGVLAVNTLATARASAQNSAAQLAEAQAAQRSAAAHAANAQAKLADAQASVAAATGVRRLMLAETQLIPAQRAAAAAAAASAKAKAAVGVAATNANRAVALLRGTLAIFGGPVGAVVTGLSLLWLWFSRNKDAADELSDSADRALKNALDRAREIQQLNSGLGGQAQERADSQFVSRIDEEIQRKTAELATLVQQRNDLEAAVVESGGGRSAQGQRNKLERKREEVEALKIEIEELNQAALSLEEGVTQIDLSTSTSSGGSPVIDFDAPDFESLVDNELTLARARLEESAAENERLYAEGERSLSEHYAERLRITRAGFDAEIAARRRVLAEAERRETADDGSAEIDIDPQTIETEISELVIQRRTAVAEISAAEREAIEQQEQRTRSLRISLLSARGEVERAAILEQRTRIAEDLTEIGETDQADAIIAEVDALLDRLGASIDSKKLAAQILKAKDMSETRGELQTEFDKIIQGLQARTVTINAEQDAGTVTPGQSRSRLEEAAESARSRLVELRGSILAALEETPDNPQLIGLLDQVNERVEGLGTSIDTTLLRIGGVVESELTSAFASVISGTTDVSSAFKAMGDSVVAQLSRIVAELIAVAIVEQTISFLAGGAAGGGGGGSGNVGGVGLQGGVSFGAPGGATGGNVTEILNAPGRADGGPVGVEPDLVTGLRSGGPVRGPGGPREDLVPALLKTAGRVKPFRLSDGEFVIRASSVVKYGKDFLEQLNVGALPSEISREASPFAGARRAAADVGEAVGVIAGRALGGPVGREHLDPRAPREPELTTVTIEQGGEIETVVVGPGPASNETPGRISTPSVDRSQITNRETSTAASTVLLNGFREVVSAMRSSELYQQIAGSVQAPQLSSQAAALAAPEPAQAAGAGSSVRVEVNNNAANAVTARAEQREGADGELTIEVLIDQIDDALGSRIGRGEGATNASIESVFGASRAGGALR